MKTIYFRPGESDAFVVKVTDPEGDPVDLTGVVMQMRISTDDTTCVFALATLTPEEDGFQFDFNDAPFTELEEGEMNHATLHIDFGDGWREYGKLIISATGGC